MQSMIRRMTTKATSMSSMMKSYVGKPEGDISSVFASLSGDDMNKPLDNRYAQLKSEIIQGYEQQIEDSWQRLLNNLKEQNSIIRSSKSNLIPQINFNEMENLSNSLKDEIRTRGVMIIRDVLPDDFALELKRDVEKYIKDNPQTKAFPQEKPVVYELYWSPSQIKARSDHRVLKSLKFANSFWHASPSTEINLSENLMYVDRLRIRPPGDNQFTLGPHVDGGSIERWEDPQYRSCYQQIFQGQWEDNDFFDATHRVQAQMSLYNTIGGCSVFRSWQGWLSLSTVNPGQGGLLVNPLLKYSTSYWLLRPFLTQDQSNGKWIIDRSSIWQGAIPGRGQEMNNQLHPHLELTTSMVSIPRVNPGDMVFWHCDLIHAVDSIHQGEQDSSVFYIPASPQCQMNIDYLVQQRHSFDHGIPPPDFPGGQGESKHIGRGIPEQIQTIEGRRTMGYEPFQIQSNMTPGQLQITQKANQILFSNFKSAEPK